MCFDLSSDRCVNQDPYIQALTLSQWSHVSVVFVFIYNLTIFIYNLTIFNYFLLPGSHIDSVNAAGQTPLAAAATGVAEIILKSQVSSIWLFKTNNMIVFKWEVQKLKGHIENQIIAFNSKIH